MAHTFGSNNVGFGNLSGWSITGNSSNDGFQRAEALGPTGNEVASNLYDEKTEVSTTYQAAQTAAPTVPATLGAVINGVTLLSIALSTSADGFVTMTLTGHKHEGSNTHGTVRTAVHGITLNSGFGVTLFASTGTAETNGGFSSSCTIECQHADALGGSGLTIAGENYDGKITINVTATGGIGSTPSGYDLTSTDTQNNNTDFLKTSATYIKALAMA